MIHFHGSKVKCLSLLLKQFYTCTCGIKQQMNICVPNDIKYWNLLNITTKNNRNVLSLACEH
jgi:hypothetical protein